MAPDCMDNEWLEPCLGLVNATWKLLKQTVMNQAKTDKHVCRFARLSEFLLRRAEDVADDVIQIARTKVEDFIRREKVPYTQNHYLSENLPRLCSKSLEYALREALSSCCPDDDVPVSTIDRIIAGVLERNQKKSVDEHMAKDMQYALDAYGKVSMKRFMDVIPMVCGDALLNFPDKMKNMLSLMTDEELNKLISVTQDDAPRRSNLTRKLSDIQEGLEVLEDLF